MSPADTLPLVLAFVLLTAVGCRREEIQVYDAPKSARPAPTAPQANMPASPGPMQAPGAPVIASAAGAKPEWTLPASWKPGRASSARIGSFAVPSPDGGEGVDISITSFPGDAGGVGANLNRWRGQIGLEPLAGAAVAEATQPRTVGGIEGRSADFTGPKGRTRVAWISREGASWFFKLSGPPALVEAESANWDAFLNSVAWKETAK